MGMKELAKLRSMNMAALEILHRRRRWLLGEALIGIITTTLSYQALNRTSCITGSRCDGVGLGLIADNVSEFGARRPIGWYKATTMKNLTGKPAIPFELPDTQGNIHRLEDDTGHWLLLVFHRHLG